jgi:hypothetical protein
MVRSIAITIAIACFLSRRETHSVLAMMMYVECDEVVGKNLSIQWGYRGIFEKENNLFLKQ